MKLFLIVSFLSIQLLANDQVEVSDDVSESKVADENITSEINVNVDFDNASKLIDSDKSETHIQSKQEDSIIEKELESDIEIDDEKKDESKISTEEIENQKSPYKIITFLIIGLFSISLFLNYLLLRWRSKYKNQLITFPENLIDQFEGLGKDFSTIKSGVRSEFERYTELLQKQSLINQETVKEVTSKYEAILESFSLLQTSLNTKDKEIERLKKGYDLQILKKFMNKYLRIIDTCDAINRDTNISDETRNEVTFILDSLNDLLEDIGIKKYSIDEGVSTKSDEFGLPPANEWIKIETDDDDKCFKVKKTLKGGYFIDAENKEVMKYPKIEVYLKGEKDG